MTHKKMEVNENRMRTKLKKKIKITKIKYIYD